MLGFPQPRNECHEGDTSGYCSHQSPLRLHGHTEFSGGGGASWATKCRTFNRREHTHSAARNFDLQERHKQRCATRRVYNGKVRDTTWSVTRLCSPDASTIINGAARRRRSNNPVYQGISKMSASVSLLQTVPCLGRASALRPRSLRLL